jgi:hypothetical protein
MTTIATSTIPTTVHLRLADRIKRIEEAVGDLSDELIDVGALDTPAGHEAYLAAQSLIDQDALTKVRGELDRDYQLGLPECEWKPETYYTTRTGRPATPKLSPVTPGMAQLADGLTHLHRWLVEKAEDGNETAAEAASALSEGIATRFLVPNLDGFNEAAEALQERMGLPGYGAIPPGWQCLTVETLDQDSCPKVAVCTATEGDWQVRWAFARADDGPLEDADWQETDPAEIGDTVDAVLYLASQGRLKLRLIEWEAAGPEDGETFAVAVDPT